MPRPAAWVAQSKNTSDCRAHRDQLEVAQPFQIGLAVEFDAEDIEGRDDQQQEERHRRIGRADEDHCRRACHEGEAAPQEQRHGADAQQAAQGEKPERADMQQQRQRDLAFRRPADRHGHLLRHHHGDHLEGKDPDDEVAVAEPRARCNAGRGSAKAVGCHRHCVSSNSVRAGAGVRCMPFITASAPWDRRPPGPPAASPG